MTTGNRQKRQRREKSRLSAKNWAKKSAAGFDRTALNVPKGVQFFNPKEGSHRIDIIPYRVGVGNPRADEGELHFERTYWVHRAVGANNDTFVCLAKTFKKPCPICEHRAKLTEDPDAEEKLIKALAPKERQLWNVIDKGEPDKGIQLWDISYHLFGKLLVDRIEKADEDESFEYFPDLDNGLTLKIMVATEKSGGYSFNTVKAIDFKPRREAYEESILDESHCLDELLAEVPYKKLKGIFLQTGAGKDEDDDDDEQDAPRSRRGKKSPPPKEDEGNFDDDDEDWDDDGGEDDEDEEPAPRERKGRKTEGKPSRKPKPKDDPTAEEAGITQGCTVDHEEYGVCTVARISGDGTSLTLLDEETKETHRAVAPSECTVIETPKPKGGKGKGKKEPPPKGKGRKPVADEDDDDDFDDEDPGDDDFDDEDDGGEDDDFDDEDDD